MSHTTKEWSLEVFDKQRPWETTFRIQHADTKEKAIEDWLSYNEGWCVKSAVYYGEYDY